MILGILINWGNLLENRNKNEIYLYTASTGRAIDHFYGGAIYSWDEGFADQDIEYKIKPNRINIGIHSEINPLLFEPDQGVLMLPEQKFISTQERVQFINFSPKEVSWFDGKKWLPTDPDSIFWRDNKSYRIIID